MRVLKSMEEAKECTAIRLTDKRQRAKAVGVFLWGRLIKKASFFGLGSELNLVYVYDAMALTALHQRRWLRPISS
jgi:hypothetical protein